MKTDIERIREAINLAVLTSRTNKDGTINLETLEKELIAIEGDETIQKNGENEGLPWTVIKEGHTFEIDEDGIVTIQGASITLSDLIVKNGENIIEPDSKAGDPGTPLQISFEASIEGGKITSITPSVPYTTDGKETSITFEIIGITKEGNTITKTYTVDLKTYYNIPELKVGDYVNYTPNTPTDEELAELNAAVNTYSGYSGQTLSKKDTALKWRVLEIDSNGNPSKLIICGSSGALTLKLGLSGANGYNNAVYLLNKICKTLYSSDKGEARSLTIEDIENKIDKNKFDYTQYNNGILTYGQTKRYTGSNTYFPTIASEENNVGINTEAFIDTDGNTKNTIKTDGINRSEQDQPYTGSSIASLNGITVTQTYWEKDGVIDIYNDDMYYKLFHNECNSNIYWLASRSIDVDSNYCKFNVFIINKSQIGGKWMYFSRDSTKNSNSNLRPIVSLNSGTQANYVGKYSSDYSLWDLY